MADIEQTTLAPIYGGRYRVPDLLAHFGLKRHQLHRLARMLGFEVIKIDGLRDRVVEPGAVELIRDHLKGGTPVVVASEKPKTRTKAQPKGKRTATAAKRSRSA